MLKYQDNVKKEELKNNLIFIFMCNICIFPFCLILNIYNYLSSIIDKNSDDQIILNLLLILVIILLIIMYITFRVSLFSFIKNKSEKYSLLLMLGITKKDFWKAIIKEYCFTSAILGCISTVLSNISTIVIMTILFWKNDISILKSLMVNWLFIMVIVILVYNCTMLGSIFKIIYKQRNSTLIEFFEELRKNSAKKYKSKLVYNMGIYIGSFFFILSICLLINYNVGKMFLAIVFQMMGIFCLFNTNGYVVMKKLKKLKTLYFKNILNWNDLVFQFNINAKIIFIIYALNFFVTFVIGGLIVSNNSSDSNRRYPYETVLYGDNIKTSLSQNFNIVPSITGSAKRIGTVVGISNRNYNKLMNTNIKLSKNEILYYEEKPKESYLPLEQDYLSITFGLEEKKFFVKENDWKIIFGEKILPELEIVVILSDTDFINIYEKYYGKDILTTSNNLKNFKIKHNENLQIWERSKVIDKENNLNKALSISIYIIGLALVVEEQGFILAKQLLNLKEYEKEYKILKFLGIRNTELVNLIKSKIKGILLIPSFLAIFLGCLFFAADYIYQEKIDMLIIIRYSLLIFGFLCIQIMGYLTIVFIIKKYYINKKIIVQNIK